MKTTYFVAQRQAHNDEIEILWECTSYEQAQDEVDRINFNLGQYGIPGDYYSYITT